MEGSTIVQQIAQVLLFDRAGQLLIYLRDDNPAIPFPNHWDLFGGHLEKGETPEQALLREVKEEIGIELKAWQPFRRFDCAEGDAYPNVKHIYWATIDKSPAELTLYEGQKLRSITMAERKQIKFANILGAVIDAFVDAGLWPKSPSARFKVTGSRFNDPSPP
jgi:8-oxo-dGTP diphosphatase